MSELKEKLRKIDNLIKIAQTREEYESCQDLYSFLGIDRKNITNDEIKRSIKEKYRFCQQSQNTNKWEKIAKEFIGKRSTIEDILLNNRSKYDDYL